MLCPYCTEDIPDEAVVCKVCHRDLQLVFALNDRIRYLEDQVRAFSAAGPGEALDETPDAEWSEAVVPRGSVAQAAGFLIICCAGGGWLLSIALVNALADNEDGWQVWLPLGTATLFPMALALWFSVWRKTSWPPAILAGLAQAFFLNGVVAFRLMYACSDSSSSCSDIESLTHGWIRALFSPALLLFSFGPALAIFLSSFWLGSKSWKSTASQPSRSRTLAQKILSRGKREQQKSFEHRVKRLTAIFSTLAPVLTLLASILVPLLGYLANSHKGK